VEVERGEKADDSVRHRCAYDSQSVVLSERLAREPILSASGTLETALSDEPADDLRVDSLRGYLSSADEPARADQAKKPLC
jgi:hypothetical protein